jgi:hypothetical protein
MKVKVILLLNLVLLCIAQKMDPRDYVWNPISLDSVPKANPGDWIDVLYLEAPLWEWEYGNLFELFNMYHGAIGLVNRRTNYSITINFDGVPGMMSAVMPTIINGSDGSIQLEWQNGGAVFIYEDVYYDYWDANISVLSTISGDVFNGLMFEYVASVNETHPHYYLWNVFNHWGGKTYIDAYDCVAFVWEALQYLYEQGAELNYYQNPKRNFASLFTSQPPLLINTTTGSVVPIQEVIDFFLDLDEIVKTPSKLDAWEKWGLLLLEGNFFIYYEQQYYKLSLQYPFFSNKYAPYPLPGQQIINIV